MTTKTLDLIVYTSDYTGLACFTLFDREARRHVDDYEFGDDTPASLINAYNAGEPFDLICEGSYGNRVYRAVWADGAWTATRIDD